MFSRQILFLIVLCFSTSLISASDLEKTLRLAPECDRPWILINSADEKLEELKKTSGTLLHLRERSAKKTSEEERKEGFDRVFNSFTNFRTQISNCASSTANKPSHGAALFAQAYYDFTELFATYVEENLFPKSWRALTFEYSQEQNTIEKKGE